MMLNHATVIAEGADVIATRVDGWDSRCVSLLDEKTQARLKDRGPALKLLSEKSSECLLVEAGGEPILFLGLIPFTLLGTEAYIWMIPFPALSTRHLRTMKEFFSVYASQYNKITAQILHSEKDERRFLEFFGFKAIYEAAGMVAYERVT